MLYGIFGNRATQDTHKCMAPSVPHMGRIFACVDAEVACWAALGLVGRCADSGYVWDSCRSSGSVLGSGFV